MRSVLKKICYSTMLITAIHLVAIGEIHACDIAVVSSKASSTGRPLIWKSRDNNTSWQQEAACYKRSTNTTNTAAGGSVRVIDRTRGTAAQSGGVNESGFAITNTTVYQESPIHEYMASANLNLMSNALEMCTTVKDFDNYVSTWNTISSNQTRILSGNFVVIDAVGGAALYELTTGNSQTDVYAYGGRVKVHKINANNGFVTNEDGQLIGNNGEIGYITDYLKKTTVQVMSKDRVILTTEYRLSTDGKSILNSSGAVVDNGGNFCGFVNRTNSSFWVNLYDDTPREDRANDLMHQLAAEGRLNHKTMLQVVAKDTKISEYHLETYPHLSNLDAGSATQQSTFHTISRYCTNLAFVVDGVAPGKNAKLATMWINLGEPSVGVATPFFPAANAISPYMYADTKILGVTLDLSDTCYMNQAMSDVRDTLYDNHCDQNLLTMLPPLDINVALLLQLIQIDWLFQNGVDAWSDFEGALSAWNVAYMAYAADQDNADKTINVPGLAAVQAWTMPLETNILNKADEYLNILRQDSTKVTETNLSKFSDYSAEYLYTNYSNHSSSYKSWAFSYPWTTSTTSTSWIKSLFGF